MSAIPFAKDRTRSCFRGIDPKTRRTFEGLIAAFFAGLLFWSAVGLFALAWW